MTSTNHFSGDGSVTEQSRALDAGGGVEGHAKRTTHTSSKNGHRISRNQARPACKPFASRPCGDGVTEPGNRFQHSTARQSRLISDPTAQGISAPVATASDVATTDGQRARGGRFAGGSFDACLHDAGKSCALAAGGLTGRQSHAESDTTHEVPEVVEAQASPSAHFTGTEQGTEPLAGLSLAPRVPSSSGRRQQPTHLTFDSSCSDHFRCPRCRNRGYYLDNDADGYRGRGNNRVRCDCAAGDPDNDN